MNRAELVAIFQETAARLFEPVGYGPLVFVHSDARGLRNTLAEADVRHVLTGVLAEKRVTFGLEMPTVNKFRFAGSRSRNGRSRSGNIDIVIDPRGPEIKIELKAHGNAVRHDFRPVEQDLVKLLCEPATGAASFHVLQESTLKRLLDGYRRAYETAVQMAQAQSKPLRSKWYVLFIVDRRARARFWHEWPDMTSSSGADFEERALNRS